MDLTRRKTLLGLSLLATGSGATLTSAAFSSSTDPSGDLRVVAAEGLVVEAGDAFADDGTVTQLPGGNNGESYVKFDANGDFFDGSGGLKDISTADLPVATVNRRDQNTNGGVKVRTAVDFESDEYTFENILRIRNTGLKQETGIGIKYAGGYGSAVSTNGITKADVKYMYKFYAADVGSGRVPISPAALGGTGPDETIPLDPGETRNITLELDYRTSPLGNHKQEIRDAADTSGNPFIGQLDTVQLLDEIEVGEGY